MLNDLVAKRILALSLGIASIILAVALPVYFVWAKTVDQTAQVTTRVVDEGASLLRDAGQAFKTIFNLEPIVQVQADTVTLKQTSIVEIALIARKMRVVIKQETTWLQSTKTLVISGEFIVKAGFDLQKSFEMNLQKEPLALRISLPEPEILSVELVRYEVVHSSDGVWNKLQPKDQQESIRLLLAQAQKDAADLDLLQECKTQVERRLYDVLGEGKVRLLFDGADQ